MDAPLLLTGTLTHQRSGPAAGGFSHATRYLLTDLASPPSRRWGPLWGGEGLGLYGLRSQHLWDGATGFAAIRKGLIGSGERVLLLTQPHLLGYVFNPLSLYLVVEDGPPVERARVRRVVAEVSNRHGGRHRYDLTAKAPLPGRFEASFSKEFYVSPFQPMEGEYRLELTFGGEELRVQVSFQGLGGEGLDARLSLHAEPFTGNALARTALRQPLTPWATTANIYGHAVRLALRGARYRRPSEREQHGG
ncbi:MAG: DUF1365 family protein [Chloroflexota bacterium]